MELYINVVKIIILLLLLIPAPTIIILILFFYFILKSCYILSLYQRWPNCGSLKDYLWLSINVPEFRFIIVKFLLYFKNYRSVCVSKCLLNYWQQIWKTKCKVVTNFILVQVKNHMCYWYITDKSITFVATH